MIEMISQEEMSSLIDFYFDMFARREKHDEEYIIGNLNITESKLKRFINYVSAEKKFVPSFANLYNIIMLTTIFKPRTNDVKRQEYVLNNNQDNEIIKIYQKKINA